MSKRRRRTSGTGSIIAVRQLSGAGLGKVGNPGSALGAFLPPLVGGGLTGAAAVLIEHMGAPSADGTVPSEMVMKLAENAPWVGVGAGLLGSLAVYAILGAPAALGAAAGTIGVAGSLVALKALQTTAPTATTEPAAPATKGGLGRYRRRMFRGVGAIVPQLQPPGMGAIVMEQRAMNGLGYGGDPRGETVSLGSVNPSAFGTPGFQI